MGLCSPGPFYRELQLRSPLSPHHKTIEFRNSHSLWSVHHGGRFGPVVSNLTRTPAEIEWGSTCVSYYSTSMLKRTIAAIRSDPEVKWFVCFCLGWSEFCQLSLCSRSGSWPQYDSDTKDKQARSAEKTPEKGNIYEIMWNELCGAHKKYSCANQPQPPANHFVVWREIFFSPFTKLIVFKNVWLWTLNTKTLTPRKSSENTFCWFIKNFFFLVLFNRFTLFQINWNSRLQDFTKISTLEISEMST